MADQLFGLTPKQAERVGKVVAAVENGVIDLTRGRALPAAVPSSVQVYKATAAGSGGEVTLKRVNVDGTLDDTEVTLKTITGIDISEDDFCIAAITADGERAAYPGGGGGVQQFKVISIDNDHLVCKTWDGTTLGSTSINVAKPPELRQSLDLPAGYTYSSYGADGQTRTSTTGGDNESQAVVLLYVAGSTIIYANKPAGGTAVTVDSEDVLWQDLNVAGRAWCKV